MKYSPVFLASIFLLSCGNFSSLEAGIEGNELYEMLGDFFLPKKERNFTSIKKQIKDSTYLKARALLRTTSEEDALNFKNALLELIDALDTPRQSISQSPKLLKAFAKMPQKTQLSYSQVTEELVEFLRPQLAPETAWSEDFILGYLKLRQTLDAERVQNLIPASFYVSAQRSNFTYSQSEEISKLANALALLSAETIDYGLKTLILDASLDVRARHFNEVSAFAIRNDTLKPEVRVARFSVAEKINIVRLGSTPDLLKHFLTFENLNDTTFILDLHGVLTIKGSPQPKETDVPARGVIVELLKDLHDAGAKLILSSAWDSLTDILEQLSALELGSIFGFSQNDLRKNESDYRIEKHILKTDHTLEYRRVGNVVSSKWEGQRGFWKEKIFAADILGFAPQRLVLIDDSIDNIQKASIQAAETQAGMEAQNIDIIFLHVLKMPDSFPSLESFALSCHEENTVPKENLTAWKEKLKSEKSAIENISQRLEALKIKEEQRIFREEEDRKKKEEFNHRRKSSLNSAGHWRKGQRPSPLNLTDLNLRPHSPHSLSPRSPRLDELAASKEGGVSSGDEGYNDPDLFSALQQESPRGN